MKESCYERKSFGNIILALKGREVKVFFIICVWGRGEP